MFYTSTESVDTLKNIRNQASIARGLNQSFKVLINDVLLHPGYLLSGDVDPLSEGEIILFSGVSKLLLSLIVRYPLRSAL